MLDFDAGKLLIIGVVALIVIGPKDLPRVLRQVGQAVARVRRMAAEFQGQFMDAMREADLEAIRDDLKKTTGAAGLDSHFDPARDIQRELTGSLDLAAATPAMLPGETAPVAAYEPSLPAPTDGFALPAAEPVPGEASAADAGAVPTAEVEGAGETTAIDPAPAMTSALAPAPEPPARKRRIRVRRRPLPAQRVHAVLDRTGLGRPGQRSAGERVLVQGTNP